MHTAQNFGKLRGYEWEPVPVASAKTCGTGVGTGILGSMLRQKGDPQHLSTRKSWLKASFKRHQHLKDKGQTKIFSNKWKCTDYLHKEMLLNENLDFQKRNKSAEMGGCEASQDFSEQEAVKSHLLWLQHCTALWQERPSLSWQPSKPTEHVWTLQLQLFSS